MAPIPSDCTAASYGRSYAFLAMGWPLVAGVLLIAGALKLFPSLVSGHANLQPFHIAVAVFEIFIAIWILAGIAAHVARVTASALFFIFFCTSVANGIRGADSCGCFGLLRLNPWLTALADLGILSLLVSLERPRITRFGRVAAPVSCALLIGLLAIYAKEEEGAQGLTVLPGDVYILRPDAWLGKRCPLLSHLVEAARLERGAWRLVLYRHDCPACQEFLEHSRGLYEYNAAHLALIEVPPFADTPDETMPGPQHWRLSGARRCFVEVPTVIELLDGVVVSVIGGLPADSLGMGAGIQNPCKGAFAT